MLADFRSPSGIQKRQYDMRDRRRQVLTVAIADKAQYIEGLRAIQERFPALPAVMTIEPPRAHANLRGAP